MSSIADLKRAIDRAARSGSTKQEIELRGQLGTLLLERGLPEKALSQHQKELALALRTRDVEAEIAARQSVGDILVQLQKFDEAVKSFAIQLKLVSTKPNSAYQVQECLVSIGLAYYEKAMLIVESVDTPLRFKKSDALLSKSLDHFEKSLVHVHSLPEDKRCLLLANVWNNLGNVYCVMLEYNRAVTLYNDALDMARRIHDRPAEARSLHNLGMVYVAQKSYQKAIEYLQLDVALSRRVDHLDSLFDALNALGDAQFKSHMYPCVMLLFLE
jgi:tetratricopeptide (TPR) repeat protein